MDPPASKKRKVSSNHPRPSPVSSPSESKYSEGGHSQDGVSRPVSVTCLSCRGRKIKCDSAKPSCGNCIKYILDPSEQMRSPYKLLTQSHLNRNNNACTYLKKQKPGLKAGSGETMMRRIEMLEENTVRQNVRLQELEDWRRSVLSTRSHSTSFHASEPSEVKVPYTHGVAQAQSLSHHHSPMVPLTMQETDNLLKNPQDAAAAAARARADSFIRPPMGEALLMNNLMETTNVLLPLRQQQSYPTLASEQHRTEYNMDYAQAQGEPSHFDYTTPHAADIWTPGSTLPRDEIVLDLIDVFMQRIGPTAFLIHPESRWEQPWNVVVHAIVASAARISSDDKLAPYRADICEAARNHVFLQSMLTTNIETMQALAIISLDILSSGKGPENWSPLAMLSRLAVNLDIWRETEDPPISDFWQYPSDGGSSAGATQATVSKAHVIQPSADAREDEARRRLFWTCVVLDRFTSASAGWDSAIPSNLIQRRFPCSDESWCKGHWMACDFFQSPPQPFSGLNERAMEALSPAAFLLEALDFMGRAHSLQPRSMNLGDVSDMDSRKAIAIGLSNSATRWYQDRRRYLDRDADGGSAHPLSQLTQGIYHVTICKLQCFYAYPAVNPTGVVEPYASQCLASAQAICELSQRATGYRADPGAISPLLIWVCWVGARVLFAHSCWEARSVIRPEFKRIVASLSEMAIRYELAAEYVKLLLRAERRWQAMNADLANSPNTTGSTSMAVSVLLDLRRTAYGATSAAKGDETPMVPLGGDAQNSQLASLEEQRAHAQATNDALQASGLLATTGTDDAEFHRLVDDAHGDHQGMMPLAGRSAGPSGINTPWSGHAGSGNPQQNRLAFGSLDNYFDHLDIFGSSFGNGFGQ